MESPKNEGERLPVEGTSDLSDGLGGEEIHLYKDTVVSHDGDFAIVECVRIFGTGWNVYQANPSGSENFEKINQRMKCFTSLDAAEKWLAEYRANNGA